MPEYTVFCITLLVYPLLLHMPTSDRSIKIAQSFRIFDSCDPSETRWHLLHHWPFRNWNQAKAELYDCNLSTWVDLFSSRLCFYNNSFFQQDAEGTWLLGGVVFSRFVLSTSASLCACTSDALPCFNQYDSITVLHYLMENACNQYTKKEKQYMTSAVFRSL